MLPTFPIVESRHVIGAIMDYAAFRGRLRRSFDLPYDGVGSRSIAEQPSRGSGPIYGGAPLEACL